MTERTTMPRVPALLDALARDGHIRDRPALEQAERLVRFHTTGWIWIDQALRSRRIQIVPDGFFFQEGHRELYEDARYGMFRFDDRGRYLLVGLADGNRIPIEP